MVARLRRGGAAVGNAAYIDWVRGHVPGIQSHRQAAATFQHHPTMEYSAR
jgi:hypothetical protein